MKCSYQNIIPFHEYGNLTCVQRGSLISEIKKIAYKTSREDILIFFLKEILFHETCIEIIILRKGEKLPPAVHFDPFLLPTEKNSIEKNEEIYTYLSCLTSNPFLFAKRLRLYLDGCCSIYRKDME